MHKFFLQFNKPVFFSYVSW